ncbi:MAG: response regulator [Oscillospiraceae bacterium]|nr:response regulator [Oscillospiraceae bacterium]
MQKLIFIVDDNDSNLTAAALALESEYRVLTMPTAEKMFQMLEKTKPDMILLDIEMPDISGLDAMKKLMGNPEWETIPILLLTSWNDEDVLSHALTLGAIDVVTKPILPSVLRNRVKNYISKWIVVNRTGVI